MTDENEPKPTGGYQFADVGYDRYYGWYALFIS